MKSNPLRSTGLLASSGIVLVLSVTQLDQLAEPIFALTSGASQARTPIYSLAQLEPFYNIVITPLATEISILGCLRPHWHRGTSSIRTKACLRSPFRALQG